jgi:predicted glycogen debranching enzyme
VEWLADEKINVHDASPLNWNASRNLVSYIQRLNLLLKSHPAFFDQTELVLITPASGEEGVILRRRHAPDGKEVLVCVNLNEKDAIRLSWPSEEFGEQDAVFTDLVSEKEIAVKTLKSRNRISLDAGQVVCLTTDPTDLDRINAEKSDSCGCPPRILFQKLRATALDVFCYYQDICDMETFQVESAAERLQENPLEYCRELNPSGEEPRVITWQWPQDVRREVMLPPEHFLLVRSPEPFMALIIVEKEDQERVVARRTSLPGKEDTHFALFTPLEVPDTHTALIFDITVYAAGQVRHAQTPLLSLSRPESARVRRKFDSVQLYRKDVQLLLGTNGRGAMSRANLAWGNLNSRYDRLLAANLSPEFPEDRRCLLARCRAWIVFQDFSREICQDCTEMFGFDDRQGGLWRFRVPVGQGQHIMVYVGVHMIPGENAVRIQFFRDSSEAHTGHLIDTQPVTLIVRPDIEDRSFHETIKAYTLPEKKWMDAVSALPDGFHFAPEPDHVLKLRISQGSFHPEPEWYYMVNHPLEAERGLDPHSDLFSPGYFSVHLKGRDHVTVTAWVPDSRDNPIAETDDEKAAEELALLVSDRHGPREEWTLEEGLRRALDAFVVKRGNYRSVIAGYPWFLDWGRDSLIVVRGLIAAGRVDDAIAILQQFGQFEENGTLPNMITGDNTANRDTSDAPLWFVQACADIVERTGNEDVLKTPCGTRTIREIVFSIGRAYQSGTPGGIVMDPASGLIYSPSHFTWMDTNFPAGTPREGYAIEIQALWYSALRFLAKVDHRDVAINWNNIAEQVQTSLLHLFWLEDQGYLSDCLHAPGGKPTRDALPDDALRPNQLWAIALKAVSDPALCRRILQSCESLLVPGAIRSLADRKLSHPLEIRYRDKRLGDPYHPYQGHYEGDEDTRRKPAYHNGTAWSWMFPVFCEAWVRTYGPEARETARAWLASGTRLINQGCVGHMPEIVDGDVPHTPRGCDAQAWSASELLRVWLQL